MDKRKFIELLSKSSTGNPYTVRFYIDEKKIYAFCSCPAGEHRKLCKHVLRIISGDESILFDITQKELLNKIGLFIQNSTIPAFISKLRDSEVQLENAQKNVKRAKINLEKELLKK